MPGKEAFIALELKMKRILVIRTGDREYAEELAKSFNKNEDSFFETLVFTDQTAYNDYIKGNQIDVLLCDEELISECDCNRNIKLICRLSEVSYAGEITDTEPAIFKYQSSEIIMEEILARFRIAIQPDLSVSKVTTADKKICCICSPIGGSYSSTFSLALAKYYSLKGKTLFISFDPFFVLPGTEKDPKGKDLTDVIFYLNGMQSYLTDFISNLTIKNGNLECINGVSHWFDLYDMSPKNMHDLLDSVCKSNCYEYFVFDVGIIGAASMEIFLISEKIFVTVKNTPLGLRKLKEWKRQLKFCGRDDLLDRITEINVPEEENLKGEYDYEMLLMGKMRRFIEGIANF